MCFTAPSFIDATSFCFHFFLHTRGPNIKTGKSLLTKDFTGFSVNPLLQPQISNRGYYKSMFTT